MPVPICHYLATGAFAVVFAAALGIFFSAIGFLEPSALGAGFWAYDIAAKPVNTKAAMIFFMVNLLCFGKAKRLLKQITHFN